MKAILLLCGVLCLCCMSFVVGRRSVDLGSGASTHATHEMNELDRLQMDTATQK